MANVCCTSYIVTGDRKQQERLYKIMKELEDAPTPFAKSDYGNTWLGCLVERLGGDWKEICCRGDWLCLELTADTLTFETETAWCEMKQVRHFIEELFNGLHIYYTSDEPGMVEYYTNDNTGKYFPDKYILHFGPDACAEYFATLGELCKFLADLTGRNVTTYEECEALVDEYDKKYEDTDDEYSLYEYEYTDD